MHRDNWTDRQYMLEGAPYEIHHYVDEVPPHVNFHEHPFYELFFFIDGNVQYTIEGKTYHLQPGDILLTNRLDIHRPEILPGRPYERIVIWLADNFFEQIKFGEDDLSQVFRDAAFRDYRLLRIGKARAERLENLCKKCIDAIHSRRIGGYTLGTACMMELFVRICRYYYEDTEIVPEDVMENEKINTLLRYINENITEDLTLDLLAEHFYMSKYYLSRQFKRYTGLSLYQYIMKKRLTISRDLLLSGSNVTQACFDCGFNDYSNYLKAFKREFGCNPSAYVRSQDLQQAHWSKP